MTVRRTILTAAVAALLVSVTAHAQKHAKWQERIESEKIAFLTMEMDLTPAEAQAFWPLYNSAQDGRRTCFEAVLGAYKALDDAVSAGKSGKEVQQLLEAYMSSLKSSNDLDYKYMDEYLKVLPAEKVARLFLGEEKFRRNQIHRLHGAKDKKE